MKKFKMGTMDVILLILGAFLFLFTIAMIIVYCITGGIPDTLCTCVFAACTGELSVMGWIKTSKDRRQRKQCEEEENEL